MPSLNTQKLLQMFSSPNCEKKGVIGVIGVIPNDTNALSDIERCYPITPSNTPQTVANTRNNTNNTSKSIGLDANIFERLIDAFDERAAILEYDQNFPRNVAERMALILTLTNYADLIDAPMREAMEAYFHKLPSNQGSPHAKEK